MPANYPELFRYHADGKKLRQHYDRFHSEYETALGGGDDKAGERLRARCKELAEEIKALEGPPSS